MAAILKWMFVLVLLLAVVGGGTAYYFYCRSDEGLRQMVLRQLEAIAPTLKFDIAQAQWDMIGRVHIYGVTIRLPDDDDEVPAIEIPRFARFAGSMATGIFRGVPSNPIPRDPVPKSRSSMERSRSKFSSRVALLVD